MGAAARNETAIVHHEREGFFVCGIAGGRVTPLAHLGPKPEILSERPAKVPEGREVFSYLALGKPVVKEQPWKEFTRPALGMGYVVAKRLTEAEVRTWVERIGPALQAEYDRVYREQR